MHSEYRDLVGHLKDLIVNVRICSEGCKVPVSLPRKHEGKNVRVPKEKVRSVPAQNQSNEWMHRSELLSAMGQLAAVVAHEIRNPLTTLKGFTQLMKQQVHATEMYVDLMLSELHAIENVISDFLALAKPASSTFQSIDLISLLQSILPPSFANQSCGQIRIFFCFTCEQVQIDCDPAQLRQAFSHILQSCVDAMPDGGDIHIHVSLIDRERADPLHPSGMRHLRESDQKTGRTGIRYQGNGHRSWADGQLQNCRGPLRQHRDYERAGQRNNDRCEVARQRGRYLSFAACLTGQRGTLTCGGTPGSKPVCMG